MVAQGSISLKRGGREKNPGFRRGMKADTRATGERTQTGATKKNMHGMSGKSFD